MKRNYFLCILVTIAALTSCKKNDSLGFYGNKPEDQIKDSTLRISQDVYLWNTQIPSGFNVMSYPGPEEIMKAIRAYSIEPGFTDPVDHYSFAMKKAEWENLSNGVSSDFGLNVFFFTDTDLRVRLVDEASPAGLAGIKRGWKITRVAGNSDINTDNTDFLIHNIYESSSTTFTFLKPDGSTADITLNSTTYQEDPVVLDTVYNEGAKKAGYLVFNSFLGDTAQVVSEFDRVFNRFVTEGITDIIVDLRYNGGGYVSLQQVLADYLVKTSANGSIMMSQVFNDNYSDLNETTIFRKRGSLNVNNLFFIVSENTASASELLINNLKPYMNVKLVGPEATYGKPVGFFPIGVGDWYVFPVSFRSTNGLGEGNYFDGIAVDKTVDDGLDKNWGDITEPALGSVLTYISTGSFATAPQSPGLNGTLESHRKSGNQKLNRKSFKGAVK